MDMNPHVGQRVLQTFAIWGSFCLVRAGVVCGWQYLIV